MGIHQRDSRYEILRIIAAVAITLNHVPCSESALAFNQLVRRFFYLGGQFGVNLFVIIGAWFLCDGSFKAERIVRIVAQMLFYTLVLDGAAIALGTPVSGSELLRGFSYWFCFGYVVMLVVAPFLQRLKERTKTVIAVVGGVMATFITIAGYIDPSLLPVRLSLKGVIIGPLWFAYVFVLVDLIKHRWRMASIPRLGWLALFILSYLLMYVVLAVTGKSYIREVCSPVCFLSALSLFGVFSSMEVGSVRWINRVAGYTFAAYLFQAHMVFRPYLWEGLFQFTAVSETSFLYLPEALLCVVVIFMAAAVLEEVRTRLMSLSPVNRLMNGLASFGDGLYRRLLKPVDP